MSASCNGCGHCCDPVVLPFSQRDVQQMLPGEFFSPEDRRFILEDLTPLRRRDGLARSRYLTQGGMTYAMVNGVPVTAPAMFYECRHFDRDTRRCMNYEHRPTLCRGYPWYGEEPDGNKALPLECSYIEDVPVEIRHPMYREQP